MTSADGNVSGMGYYYGTLTSYIYITVHVLSLQPHSSEHLIVLKQLSTSKYRFLETVVGMTIIWNKSNDLIAPKCVHSRKPISSEAGYVAFLLSSDTDISYNNIRY